MKKQDSKTVGIKDAAKLSNISNKPAKKNSKRSTKKPSKRAGKKAGRSKPTVKTDC